MTNNDDPRWLTTSNVTWWNNGAVTMTINAATNKARWQTINAGTATPYEAAIDCDSGEVLGTVKPADGLWEVYTDGGGIYVSSRYLSSDAAKQRLENDCDLYTFDRSDEP